MPYRRLPNTDKARIRSLAAAVEQGDLCPTAEMPFSFHVLSEARAFLQRFEVAHRYYLQCYSNQVKASARHLANIRMARMYISHFVQVLNMAVMRAEIKSSCKELYHLSEKNMGVPFLGTESALVQWGNWIIEGEKKRLDRGGVPIYNPTIAKVRVHYDLFIDSAEKQKALQELTAQSLRQLAAMREQADKLILEIWDGVEAKFAHITSDEQRMNECRKYGLVYYYRTGEERPV